MRVLFVCAGLVLPGVAPAQSDEHASPPASLVMESPLPADAASGKADPVLQDITWRDNVKLCNGNTVDLVPDFHFLAPNGNAVVLRRELVTTSGAFSQTQIANATIDIPAEAQKKGAVMSGGWQCGADQYYITLRAFVMDADGNRSNAMRYTIHCNGG
jgi:hypothetical protein